MPSVEFYVVSDSMPDAHLRQACRIAEQAVEQGQRVFVRVTDAGDQKRIDDLLWTFGDRSFLPHELATPSSPSHDRVRILIGPTPPREFRDVVINLSADAAADVEGVQRVAEFVASDPERKAAARERFKIYRGMGLDPVTHTL
jgi:DNA polymerase III subunit chi